MKQLSFSKSDIPESIEVIESDGIKRVLVKGQPYMSWQSGDDASQRLAIAQLYESKLATQQTLARIFERHLNAVQSYITNFARDGLKGLISQRSGPKQRWKLTPRLRSKILLIALKEGILEYEAIQKRLEGWDEQVSLPSIRQVLLENGLVKERIGRAEEKVERKELFDNPDDEKQLYLGFNWDREAKEIESGSETNGVEDAGIEDRDNGFYPGVEIKPRRYYSPAQRTYLDQLEQGCYNTYAGGMLFAPLLQRYSFLPTIKRIINIPTYEGYNLEELCLTIFYFDLFGFRSMEDFKRVYSEEFGTLLGRSYSPSLFTLRRFLHKVKELKQKRANLKTELSQIKSRFGHEVLEEMAKEAKWDEIKKKRILTISDIEGIRSQITLLNQEIDEHPEKISFNEAHGKRLLELNYEKKRFLDCIKVFTYNMKNRMCRLLLNYYDKKKELLPALSMIVERTGYVKLEDGKLRVQLRRFRNPEIDYAARHLCEDLNRMKPVTLDRFRFPIRYEVL